MVYTKYLTIYDDTKRSSSQRSNDAHASSTLDNRECSSSYLSTIREELEEKRSKSRSRTHSAGKNRTSFRIHARAVDNDDANTIRSYHNDGGYYLSRTSVFPPWSSSLSSLNVPAAQETHTSEMSSTTTTNKLTSSTSTTRASCSDLCYNKQCDQTNVNQSSIGSTINSIINSSQPINVPSRTSDDLASVKNKSGEKASPPTLQLDLEINTPKSDIKISRKCKSYELIFNSEYTRGMNQNFHTDHFSCWNCDQSLTGSRYILKDEHPYCIKCYETLFAHNCELCKSKIGTDSKDLSYKDMHWHEKCFFCCLCNIKLVDKPFGYKNDRLYCGECYNQTFASRCDKCAQIFKPGMKKMEYKGQQFHENCFLCFTCNLPIGTKSFIPKENKIYCVPCYEQNFATKCNKCTKVISQGGVSYKNQPFHRECFTCTNCQQSLAGQRFTSRDEHPYCSDCFGKLFAKKCYSCHKPITGIGGTKYISFEDRHWHNECFVCNQCHTSLVGRGFLTDAMDILCPDCGRN